MPEAVPAPAVEPPFGLLAELTHRCPLRCPHCSNPLALTRMAEELDATTWGGFAEAAALGVLQVHLSGGEPAARCDLAEIVGHAARAGLYTNLITSGVTLDAARLASLVAAGLDHVQLSVQDAEADSADRIGGMRGGHARKLAFAAAVRVAGLPLTLNAVVHRSPQHHLLDLAVQEAAAATDDFTYREIGRPPVGAGKRRPPRFPVAGGSIPAAASPG